MQAALNILLNLLLRMRWAYFHICPGYTKIYMDEDRTEAHFFHAKTNSLHSNFRARPNAEVEGRISSCTVAQ